MDLAKFFIIYSSKSELDQLQFGLETLDVLQFMKKHADFIKPLFAEHATELMAQAMLELFEINWSLSGTITRGTEEAVIVAWTEYVWNIKGTATTDVYQNEHYFSLPPLAHTLFRWTIDHDS